MEEKKRIKIALGEFGTGSGSQELFEKLSDKMAREAARQERKFCAFRSCLPAAIYQTEELLAAALTAGEQGEKMAATAKKYGIS